MRVAVFALATVWLLSGYSAYADSITAPTPQGEFEEIPAAPLASVDVKVPSEGSSVQLLDVQTDPSTAAPVRPTAVTPEPSGVVLMATGLIGISGMLWRRRSLTR